MASESVLKIRVQGEVHELDFDHMLWGELSDLEDLLGCSLEEANLATAKGVLALAYIAARRSQPAVTLDSLRALPMTEIELVEDDTVDPTPADKVGEDVTSGPQA
jgi:hypothetical protein